MALYILLPLSLSAFLFFHYFVTPRVKKSKSDNRWVAKFGKPGLLAILKYVYTFFFLATLTYALLSLIAFVVSLSTASSAAGFESAITRVQAYRAALKVFKSYWGLAVFVFIFMAVTTILYRRLRDAIQSEIEEERRRLERGREKGEWESFEPTPEMREVAKKIHAAQVLFDGLDPAVFPQTKESQDARSELKEKIQGLRAKWHDLDLERRAYLSLEARQSGDAGSSSRKESWARSFFGSKGFLGVLQSVSRATGHVGLILLFVSLLGVNTPVFDRALARSLVRLTDLQVKANQKEARESFAKLMSREEDGGERDPKKEDEKALRDLSRHFERAFTSSDVWHHPFVYHGFSPRVRKDLVRDQIIVAHGKKPPDGPDSPDHDGGGSDDKGGPGPHGGGPEPGGPDGGGGGGGEPHPTGFDTSGEVKPPVVKDGPRGDPPKDNTKPPRPKPTPIDPDGNGDEASVSGEDIRGRLSRERGPQTGIGKRFLSDVRRGIAGKTKKFWVRIKVALDAHARKFGEPFDVYEFGPWAAGEMMGATVDSVWHQVPEMGEVNDPLKGVIKAGLKEAAKKIPESGPGGRDLAESAQRVYDLSFEQFMTDLSDGMPLDEALRRVSVRVAGRPVASVGDMMRLSVVSEELLSSDVFEELAKSLNDYPPTLSEAPRDVAEAEAAALKLEGTLDSQGNSSLAEAEFEKFYVETESYEQNYPGRLDAHQASPRGKLLEKMHRPLDAKVSEELYAQAQDFSQLKLSPSLGGVLVGRAPEGVASDVDFRDLSWVVDGDKVTLRLKREDGGEIVLGPYSKEIVNDALVFVADGRKAVVTIKNSLREDQYKRYWRRVMLHPALIDRALGRDIVEFDELVFKFIDGDPQHEAARQRVRAQELSYSLAWVYRRQLVRHLLSAQATDPAKLAAYKSGDEADANYLRTVVASPKNNAAISLGFKDKEIVSDRGTSLLLKYPDYFDPQLVQIIVDCEGAGVDSVENFRWCVQRAVRTLAKDGLSKEVTAKWMGRPVRLSSRSIAEEISFNVDSGLKFLSPEDTVQPAAQLWPFEFRYEIAFPTSAPFLPEGEKREPFRTPWEYRDLRTLIANKVARGVQADARIRELFGRVREFEVLERLFRTSLDGGLGEQFPFEKLVGLTRATEGSKRGTRTPRWEVKPIIED